MGKGKKKSPRKSQPASPTIPPLSSSPSAPADSFPVSPAPALSSPVLSAPAASIPVSSDPVDTASPVALISAPVGSSLAAPAPGAYARALVAPAPAHIAPAPVTSAAAAYPQPLAASFPVTSAPAAYPKPLVATATIDRAWSNMAASFPALPDRGKLVQEVSSRSEPKKVVGSGSAGNHVSFHPDKETITPIETKNTQSRPSWAECVKGSSGKMRKKGDSFVLDSGELCVKIPNAVITKNANRWEHFILGQFHGRTPSPGALHAIFNGIWSNKHRDITASKFGERTVLIRIPNTETRKRVLNQGIWHIEGQTMFVAKWEPGLNPSMPELTQIPVWLEFRGVPPHFFSIEGFEYIAGLLGEPLHCHPTTVNMTNLEVGRVFTVINPLIPLPEAVNIQFATGEIHRVKVSSPWLPPICDHCSEIGHTIRRCPTAPITCTFCESTSHVTISCPRQLSNVRKNSEKKERNTRFKEKLWEEKSLPGDGKLSQKSEVAKGDVTSGETFTRKDPVRHASTPEATPNLRSSNQVKDSVGAPSMQVTETAHEESQPLRTYKRKNKGKKVVKRVSLIPDVNSDENAQGKAETSESSVPTDYTSDDVSDTGDEPIKPYSRVLSKKERSFERTNRGTRLNSTNRLK